MITREKFDKLDSEYESTRKEYNKKSEELNKLSEELNGKVTDKLAALEKEVKDLGKKTYKYKQCRDKAGQEFVDENLPYIDEDLREVFINKHAKNMRNGNWKPVVDELDELIKTMNDRKC